MYLHVVDLDSNDEFDLNNCSPHVNTRLAFVSLSRFSERPIGDDWYEWKDFYRRKSLYSLTVNMSLIVMAKRRITLRERRQEIINQHIDLNINQRPFFELNFRLKDPFTPVEKEAMAKQEILRKEIHKLDKKIGFATLWIKTTKSIQLS